MTGPSEGSAPTSAVVLPAGALDDVCAAAAPAARAAAVEVGGADVGEHAGCQPLDDGTGGVLADHRFACVHPGYRGWQWSVTVVRAPGSETVTVDEVALLPGPDAVLAPPWVPWSERLRPGDLGPGDLLPTPPGDPRLVPAFADADDEFERAVAFELGLGRARVLSREGRDDVADRWYAGEGGPDAPIAQQAPARCGACGFYLPLAGSLGLAFGACANGYAADDGRVVSADHGCGAHSEAVEPAGLPQADAPPPLIDDFRYEYEVTPS